MREIRPSASRGEIVWPRRWSRKDTTVSRFFAGDEESGRTNGTGSMAGGAGAGRLWAICKGIDIKKMGQSAGKAHLVATGGQRLGRTLVRGRIGIGFVVVDIDGRLRARVGAKTQGIEVVEQSSRDRPGLPQV